jgi:REP-associated tyrosine transposase
MIINYNRLSKLLGLNSVTDLKEAHAKWVEEALKLDRHSRRDSKWSQSVAIGSENYIERIKKELRIKTALTHEIFSKALLY